MKNLQKSFINIVLIVLVVILAGAVGYFALVKKSPTSTSETLRKNRVTLKLTPYQSTHFTIGLPEGWDAYTPSENGDQVIITNPKEPDTFIFVFTFKVTDGGRRWPEMEERWQFAARNPISFNGDDGHEWIAAEGPLKTDPTKQILAVGYQINEGDASWEIIAEGAAPKEQFESMKPLFTAILKSLKPHPINYGMGH